MKLKFYNSQTQAELQLFENETTFIQDFYNNKKKEKFYTIAWNKGKSQNVIIDEVTYIFPQNSILPLVAYQCYKFEYPNEIRLWQFNTEFYCILNHDKEVSCIGFLFYSCTQIFFILLDKDEHKKIELLFLLFVDEFSNNDNLQGDMLRMLLVRFIINITRLAKQQLLPNNFNNSKYDLIRNYNQLVEFNFKEHHNIQFYANLLHKSPKTISNVFALYNHKTPLNVIQERIILEAKRLLYYTQKSSKEIAYELGFKDAANFSRFFKNHTGQAPKMYKNNYLSNTREILTNNKEIQTTLKQV